ncbi:hypothetical protein DFH08DRAFT_859570 [Mycena albidolilacea]|uniref:F-box domain-containing protein n=1 Tax=Mycena albidolilacea TaxID=1033008 RepID=A0AAD7A9E6_9AGAR|nr:hypothetical protein DFH08DRAFT_859570 [Mycena albidolilacea]
MQLSNDLLCLILDLFKEEEDRVTLFRCCLVNWEFNRAASRVLYSEVFLNIRPSGASNPSRSGNEKFCNKILSSASLPQNAAYVKVLRVKGYPDSLSETLFPAVKTFSNLQIVEIAPDQSRDDLFTPILEELVNRPSLVELHVNSACTDEINAPLLSKISGLVSLGLEGPNRAILQLLLDWLGRLTSLQELHLTRNCGSITPGVLRSFVPFLANITAFSLGISYSITDDDLFKFLAQLPCLERVQLRHYLQWKVSAPGDPLKRLHSLTVCHDSSDEDEFVDMLCAWIIRAITASPIECIRFCCDEFPTHNEAPRGFDALVEHLSRSNADTLRVLDLKGWLISAPSVSLLFGTCAALEELVTALDSDGFQEFKNLIPTMKRLHTAVVLVICDFADAPFETVSAEEVVQIMQNSDSLRRLAVNEWRIEGSWVPQQDGVRFVVQHSLDAPSEEEAPEIDVPQSQHSPQAPAMDAILEEEEEEE